MPSWEVGGETGTVYLGPEPWVETLGRARDRSPGSRRGPGELG